MSCQPLPKLTLGVVRSSAKITLSAPMSSSTSCVMRVMVAWSVVTLHKIRKSSDRVLVERALRYMTRVKTNRRA